MSKSHYLKRVTVKLLVKHRACEKQIARFSALFPNGCVLTRHNLSVAAVGQLNLRWAVYHLMPYLDAEEVISAINHNDSTRHQERIKIYDIFQYDADPVGRAARRDEALRQLYFKYVTSEAATIADFLELH